ncbi:hypothetical protein PROFUN_12838 [Planoprotostelium fungivorum]|uniref:Homeobox domain-containing protein n=1 Tax=Planoprotostelium fungivorum TaxID=1890364 RepID=A0A2P6N6L7_9EUKA|nr:hypothetical protein PROFUN_12838 [Planoprotostelium fungivorum]
MLSVMWPTLYLCVRLNLRFRASRDGYLETCDGCLDSSPSHTCISIERQYQSFITKKGDLLFDHVMWSYPQDLLSKYDRNEVAVELLTIFASISNHVRHFCGSGHADYWLYLRYTAKHFIKLQISNLSITSRRQLDIKMNIRDIISRDVPHETTMILGSNVFSFNNKHVRQDRRHEARVSYSQEQKRTLIREYELKPYLSNQRRRELSDLLGITERAIRIWFQNRRARTQFRKGEDIPSPPRIEETVV